MSTLPRQLVARTSSKTFYICSICRWSTATLNKQPWQSQIPDHSSRQFSTTSSFGSGHSKWATIKHDKGKNDAAKNRQRTLCARDITNAVKLTSDASPTSNPRLALAIATAKKSGIPKSVIESAIARGQGISASGTALESVVVEAMLEGVAMVVECETDNKLRTLADIRLIIKESGGAVTPTGYLFEKKGRIVFQPKEGVDAEEVLESAVYAGALDIEESAEGKAVVFTEPNETKATGETIAQERGLEIERSEIIWDPNRDTLVPISDESARTISEFLDEILEVQGVQGVYMNFAKGDVTDEVWEDVKSRVVV